MKIKTYTEFINENKSNLNDNFWKWFGNSEVVDNNGDPMICYHGTNVNFDKFKVSKYGSNGAGIYLTPYKDIAEMSGNILMPVYVKIENESDGIVAGYEVIVKNPKNIKSINNDGSFDLDDDNIYS